MRRLLAALALALVSVTAWAYEPGRLGFAVEANGLVNPYHTLALFVLPKETLDIAVTEDGLGEFRLKGAKDAKPRGTGAWRWRTPAKAGLYPLTITRVDSGEVMTLNVFVMVPRQAVKKGSLNGYAIGSYPRRPKDGLPIYLPPRGFIELTEANQDTLVAPHLTLGQFACKQLGGYPKYLVLNERLLLQLEMLLEEFNAAGHLAERFEVMSGYRTPFYNRQLGNAKFSYHQFGGAADVFIDNDRDGNMDDLNGDGVVDAADADTFYDFVDALSEHPAFLPFLGGLGRYDATEHHGPFVHVDVRGFRARWGRPGAGGAER